MSHRCRLLIIGYGNEIRGDDAAGPLVARLVESSQIQGVRTLAVPLLLPDLAHDMAAAEQVLFVDASLRCCEGRIKLGRVEHALQQPVLSCAFSPGMMAGFCELLYGHRIKAWLLEVPASEFDFSATLSNATALGIAQAIDLIRRWTETRAAGFENSQRIGRHTPGDDRIQQRSSSRNENNPVEMRRTGADNEISPIFHASRIQEFAANRWSLGVTPIPREGSLFPG